MSLAKQVRRTREERGFTQSDMVGQLREAGLAISRGHYANLERGAYDFTDEQVAALERVLSVSLTDRDAEADAPGPCGATGRNAPSDDYPDEIVRAGRKLNEYLAESDLGWTAESLGALAGSPLGDHPSADVVEDPHEVERRVVRMLLEAADRPDRSPPILLLGFSGASLRYGRRIGLSKEVRRAIRYALMEEQRCIHVVRTNANDRDGHSSIWDDGELREDTARFVQVVGQLLRAPRYEAFAAPARHVGTIDAAIVVPGVGAVQFYGGATSGRFEAALFLRDPRMVEVVADHIRQLVVASKPLTHRRFERDPATLRGSGELTGPELDDDELHWAEYITELTERPCARSYAYLFLPTELWPADIYARRVEARRRACDDPETKGDRRWQVLGDWQAAQHESLCEQLRHGFGCRVVLPSSTLSQFARDGRWAWATQDNHPWMTWTPAERVEVLESIVGLLDEHPNFEIGLAGGARWRRQLESVRWAVHDASGDGVATVRVLHRGEGGHPVATVDMEIRQPEIVQAFAAHFGDLWRRSWDITTDRASVRAELEQALTRVRELRDQADQADQAHAADLDDAG